MVYTYGNYKHINWLAVGYLTTAMQTSIFLDLLKDFLLLHYTSLTLQDRGVAKFRVIVTLLELF